MGSVPAAIRSLRDYYNVRSVTLDPKQILEDLEPETDRAVVVILGSLLEDQLTEVIRFRLRKMEEDEEKELRLFKYDGPFGGFSTKITVAYAMGLIDEDIRLQLDEIREMRNACAHSFKPISFETPQLANVCKRLFQDGRSVFPLQRVGDYRTAFLQEATSLMVAITHGSREAALSFIEKELELPPGSLPRKPQPPPNPTDPASQK